MASKYQKLSPLEHILTRPDTYVGSLEKESSLEWVLNEDKSAMVQKQIQNVSGLNKIFDEILVNAIDQSTQDKTLENIKVTINKEKGEICVTNDGKGIPILIHEKEKMYVPEMIFGELLTSSNYDDSEDRTVGGRNGYGAKLANIFSTKFMLPAMGSIIKQATSSPCSLKAASSASTSLKGSTKVCCTTSGGTPALVGLPNVARPEPALTNRASAWPW